MNQEEVKERDELSKVHPASVSEQISGRYTWSARYQDGKEFHQYSDGQERSLDDIDRTKLYFFRLIDLNGKTVFMMDFEKGQYPILRKRSLLEPLLSDVIHIIGYREKKSDTEFSEHVCFVYESGKMIVGKFKDDHFTTEDRQFRHSISYKDIDNIAVE